jgi:uroporphyrinogen-III decarboxylase
METEWARLTAEEKREKRFISWLYPEDIAFNSHEAQEAYRVRVKRIIAAIKLEEPDRVPVISHPGYAPAFYSGYTIKEVMYDSEKLLKAWYKFMDDFDLDVLPDAHLIRSGRAMEIVGVKTSKWAGCGLPDNVSPQHVEIEILKASEWDHYENDRSDFNLRVMLPRTHKAAEPFAKLPPLSMLGGFGGASALAAFAAPDIQAAFKAFADASEIEKEWHKALNAITDRGLKMGFPNFFRFDIGGGAPLDALGAGLRGTKGIIMDMFQRPERLLSNMDKMADMSIKMAAMMPFKAGTPVIFIPLHRGADGFMSEAQFKTFYWPFLKRVVEGYINEGLVPLLFAEGGYNSRLELIQDLPDKGVVWYFDQTDIIRAKEILGNRFCIMGNVPTSMMVTGKADDVKAYSKRLIEKVGKGGGYILAPGATADEAKFENIRAMNEAARGFGKK